jgi:hypothetical protein
MFSPSSMAATRQLLNTGVTDVAKEIPYIRDMLEAAGKPVNDMHGLVNGNQIPELILYLN